MPPQQTQGKMSADQAAAALGFATSISRGMLKQGYTDFADMGKGQQASQQTPQQTQPTPQQAPQTNPEDLKKEIQQEVQVEVKKAIKEEMGSLRDEIKSMLNE